VDVVYRGEQREEIGLDTERAGDLVAFSEPDAWFEYRWFDPKDAAAPPWAWTVDIHRKPGFDPTEMFVDMERRRIRADEPQLVKGSHGRLPADEADWPLLIGCESATSPVDATDVAGLL
jgi:hypothetical protein